MLKRLLPILVFCLVSLAQATEYKTELNITYCKVGERELKLNAFTPVDAKAPAPVMVDIHGGWWSAGSKASKIPAMWGGNEMATLVMDKGIAFFSIDYRLGKEGGFPENIRDCRNAIRFIRKNAERFNIDPNRIGCFGGSAGSHLSMMVAMVPEDFEDGGPTDDLKGVSAKVSNAFSFVGPTDFVAQWNEAPSDEIEGQPGKFRAADGNIPHDARPRHRILLKGITPDTEEHKALYRKMSPIGHVRKDIAPLLICDGEKDPIVPHLHGKTLHEKLQAVGADSTYWMTANGGHAFPSGPGFLKVLDAFLTRTLKLQP